jgi:cytochrome oxidase Cu insertion factor (SCO1/SenC/PrrC family)
MSQPDPVVSPPAASSSGGKGWIGMLIGIVGVLVAVLYLGRMAVSTLPKPPLPVLAPAWTGSLTLTERDGQPRTLPDLLQGKVTICASLYTVCPHGCAAIVAEMRKLNEAHRGHPDFQQLSLALAPERDNASFLKSYAEGIGVKPGDPWWFLTGPQQGVWDYLTQAQKLDPPRPIPEEKRLNPLDFYEHDLRIVVLDRQGRVRGYYSVFHPQPEIAETMSQKLARDVERLLENPAD